METVGSSELLLPPTPIIIIIIIMDPRASPHFMEHEGSLPHPQQPATCPYPEPDGSNPCTPHLSSLLSHSNFEHPVQAR
jgi:hypothetical protein